MKTIGPFIRNKIRRDLGKPHISILSTRNVICSFGGGGGGGQLLAAVTFLCETSWKNSIAFFESLNILESSLQNIKINNLIQRPVYTLFVLYL